jgi:ABC-type multidrug transport system fused ATPase/permease subunit
LSSEIREPRIALIVWRVLTSVERRKLISIWFLILVGMVIETLSLGLILPLIGLLTNSDYQGKYPKVFDFFGNPSDKTLLVAGSLVLVAIYAVKNTFLYFSASIQRKFINNSSARISQMVFKSYLAQPYEFHLTRNSATLIRNAENANSVITGGLDPFLVLLTDGLVAVGLFVLLMLVEPVGTLCVLVVFGGAAIGFQALTRKRITEWGRLRKTHMKMVLKHLQQGLGGVKEIKVLGRENEFFIEHEHHLVKSMAINRKYALIQLLPRLWLEVLAIIGLAILVAVMASTREDVSSFLPTLGLFAATAFRILPSIGRIMASFQTIAYSSPLIRTVDEDLRISVVADATQNKELVFKREIKFENVSFSYASAHRPSLQNVSLSILLGEAVGIVGPSGAGKSTLVDIFLGLLSPSEGVVSVDGEDIATGRRSWQDQVGYVPQSIYLVDDSLIRNIALGIPHELIDHNAVLRALRAAQLEEFVSTLPLGLETVVGERGVRLSGGQRQRIGIARALYSNPQILVLDEATSSLDTDTERGVMDAVRALQGDKTVVIVAHRLSTVSYCSKIFNIEDAQLIASSSRGVI